MTKTSTHLSDILSGHRLTERDLTSLLTIKAHDALSVAVIADEMRERRVRVSSPW